MQKEFKTILFSLFLFLLLIGCSGPKPAFMMEKDKQSVPATISFVNQSENADSFIWDFGDGNMSTDSAPQHQYLLSGRYFVELKAIKGGREKTLEKQIVLSPPGECLVQMETTMGTMLIKLYDVTPAHRDNFTKLADEGFYDGLLFHRVIEGFMIQGGDPNSRDAGPEARLGSGGPGYQIEAEFVDSLLHLKGALAAARQGDQVNPQRKSSGSQFYIVQGKKMDADQLKQIEARTGNLYTLDQRNAYQEVGGTPFLDRQYTVFGRVIQGMEVIDSIAGVKTSRTDRPLEDLKIISVKVIK